MTSKETRTYVFQTDVAVYEYEMTGDYYLNDGLQLAYAIHADRKRGEVTDWWIKK